MKKILSGMICVLLCSVYNAAPVFSAELNDIVLEDGSIIRAEVISFQNGKYTLRSESIGVVTIDSSQVSQILRHKANQSQAPLFSSSPEMFQANVEKAQTMLMKDPEAMQVVASMASDPNFKELLDDPASVAALKSGDMAALLKNPRFLAIMQDPKMQDMAAKVINKSKD
jgi:hypothetical protein